MKKFMQDPYSKWTLVFVAILLLSIPLYRILSKEAFEIFYYGALVLFWCGFLSSLVFSSFKKWKKGKELNKKKDLIILKQFDKKRINSVLWYLFLTATIFFYNPGYYSIRITVIIVSVGIILELLPSGRRYLKLENNKLTDILHSEKEAEIIQVIPIDDGVILRTGVLENVTVRKKNLISPGWKEFEKMIQGQ